jgi:hypothetical protein
LSSIVLKVLAYSLYKVLQFPSEFLNWVKVRVLGIHKRYTIEDPLVVKDFGKYAVFAIYPGTTSEESCLRIIESLVKNDFDVLIVINRNAKSTAWVNFLKGRGCTILERPNIGRDFGAYQAGIRFLLKNIPKNKIKRLVLVNDTCYVSPKSQVKFLNAFFAQDEYSTLLKHYQGVVHGSANLLTLNLHKFDSSKFFHFWRKYYPTNSRIKVVFRGEHRLSSAIQLKNLIPSTKILGSDSHRLNLAELSQLLTWTNRSSPEIYEVFQQLNTKDPAFATQYLVQYCLENLQVSNGLGLYLSRRYFFPLKLDLPYYLLATRSHVIETLRNQGCSKDECLKIYDILESKGSLNIGSPVERIFRAFGIIT